MRTFHAYGGRAPECRFNGKPRPKTPTSTRAGIAWTCDECGGEVGDGEGWVRVRVPCVREAERAMRAWRRRAGVLHTAAELLADPPPPLARWHVLHRACDEAEPEEGLLEYWFGVERARTAEDLLAWTAHLLEKEWLPWTAWSALLRRAAAG